MERCIDADKIISHLNDEIEACGDCDVYSQPVVYGTYLGLTYARSVVETAETADVKEVRHGHWERCFEDWRRPIEGDECSACGSRHYGTYICNYNYCPKCGAKMDGKDN